MDALAPQTAGRSSGHSKGHSHGLMIGLALRADSAWPEDFFPQDLPSDWRLDYYANEYQTLCLNTSAIDDSLLDDIDELDEEFDFALELPAVQSPARPEDMDEALLARTRFVVREEGTTMPAGWSALTTFLRTPDSVVSSLPVPLEDCGQSDTWCLFRVQQLPTPADLRASMENLIKVAHLQRVYCYFDGKAAHVTAQQAISIAGLMGVL